MSESHRFGNPNPHAGATLLLVMKRLNRVQSRRSNSRINTKDQTNRRRDPKRYRDCKPRNHRAPLGIKRHNPRYSKAEQYAGQPSQQADCYRLGQKLLPDIAPPRSHCSPHPDLASPLQYIGQHYIHDPDAADQQRNACDAAHYYVEYSLRALVLLQKLAGNYHRKVIFMTVSIDQNLAYQNSARPQSICIPQSNHYLVKLRLKSLQLEFLQRGRNRDINVVTVVLQLYSFELVFCQRPVFKDPDNREPEVVDLDLRAHSRAIPEQLFPDPRSDNAKLLVRSVIRLSEHAPFGKIVSCQPEICRGDPNYVGVVALALKREDLVRLDALPGRMIFNIRRDCGDRLDIPQAQTHRVLANPLQILVFELPIAHDDITQSHAVNQAQALLFGAGAYRKHCYHRPDSEDHAEHCQECPQLVTTQVAHCQLHFADVVHACLSWRHRRRPETTKFASQAPAFRPAREFQPDYFSPVFSASSRRSRSSFRPRLLITARQKI